MSGKNNSNPRQRPVWPRVPRNENVAMTPSEANLAAAELAIVMPVYNEAGSLRETFVRWNTEIAAHTRDYFFVFVDDGSVDDSPSILRQIGEEYPDKVVIITQGNAGHGTACFTGYRRAFAAGASWVLQIDSDGQCLSEDFGALWAAREASDVCYGRRFDRRDGLVRALGTHALRVAVRLASGEWLDDPNVPFRLMCAARLPGALGWVAPEVVLKNVALCVVFRKAGLREAWFPIGFGKRVAGRPHASVIRLGCRILCTLFQIRSLSRSLAAAKSEGLPLT